MREVAYDASVSQQIDAAAKLYPRIEDAVRALEWRLRHRPLEAVQRPNLYFIYRQKGFKSLNIPDIVVLYRYENEIVNIRGIRILPPE